MKNTFLRLLLVKLKARKSKKTLIQHPVLPHIYIPFKKTWKQKKSLDTRLFSAENVGFEPTVPLGTTVFKTAAIDHSANSPGAKLAIL